MKWLHHIRVIIQLALFALIAALIVCCHDAIIAKAWITLDWSLAALAATCVWLAITLLMGRIYCSTMCPIGTLLDVVSWLNKRINHHGHGHFTFRFGDWRLRFLTLLLIAVSLSSDWANLAALTDPIALIRNAVLSVPVWIQGGVAVTFGIVASVVVLLAIIWMGWRDGRSFCNTVCPVGTLLGTASAVSLMHLEIDPDICVNCGKCERECKAHCVNCIEHTIDTSRCVMCMNCISQCPNRAISYRPDRKRLSTPMMQRTPQLNC